MGATNDYLAIKFLLGARSFRVIKHMNYYERNC